MRVRRLVVAAALVAVLLLSALVGGWHRYPVASASRPGGGYHLAMAGGTLDGQVNLDGTACVWLAQGLDRTAIYWPYGYTAGGWPLSIYDDSGKRLAWVGQHVWLGGGFLPDSVSSIPGCSGFERFWGASPGLAVA
jgi:hypothetical protein